MSRACDARTSKTTIVRSLPIHSTANRASRPSTTPLPTVNVASGDAIAFPRSKRAANNKGPCATPQGSVCVGWADSCRRQRDNSTKRRPPWIARSLRPQHLADLHTAHRARLTTAADVDRRWRPTKAPSVKDSVVRERFSHPSSCPTRSLNRRRCCLILERPPG